MFTYRRVFLSTLIVVATLLGIYFLYRISEIVITLLAAIIFAAAIRPLVERLQRRLIPKPLAILIVYVSVLFFLGLLLLLVVPPLVQEATALVRRTPEYLATVQNWLPAAQEALGQSPVPINLAASFEQVLGQLPSLATGFVLFTFGVLGLLFGLVIVLVVAFYWLMERDGILRLWLGRMPPQQRARTYAIWVEIEEKLGSWVRGQLILAGAIGVMSYVGLMILGVNYALVLAIIAAATEVVPMVGPFLGAAPAILVALAVSPFYALLVAILYIIIQQVENHILVPNIMRSATGVSPLTVLIAILIGGSLLGIVGALLAVPVAATLYVLVRTLLLEPKE